MGKSRLSRKKNSRTRQSGQTRSPRRMLGAESLEHRLLLASDWQNPGNRFDVDDNVTTQYEVVPLDANIVITELNNRRVSSAEDGSLPAIESVEDAPQYYLDVSGDMHVTPLDAIQVINRLNEDFSDGPTSSFVPTSELATASTDADAMADSGTAAAVNNPDSAAGSQYSVMVWEAFDGTEDTWSIRGQRFDLDGAKLGEEFAVSTDSTVSHRFPVVAVDPFGSDSFAVAWQTRTELDGWDVMTRSFDSDGNEVLPAARASETVEGNQTNPDVAYASEGGIEIIWQGNGEGDNSGIFSRFRYNGLVDNDSGFASGSEVLRNLGNTAGRQSNPSVVWLDGADGMNYLVTWEGPASSDPNAENAIFVFTEGSGSVRLPVAIATGSDVSHPALAGTDDAGWVLSWLDGDAVMAQVIPEDSPILEAPVLSLTFDELPALGAAYDYHVWTILDGSPTSAGSFDINAEGNAVDSNGDPAAFAGLQRATDVIVSIESSTSTPSTVSGPVVLGGTFDASGAVSLSIDHAMALGTDFSSATGKYLLATPTTTDTTDELSGLWFLDPTGESPTAGLDLPELPSGWVYEGWAVIDGTPVSTGRFTSVSGADDFNGFSGSGGAPPFPGEDFVTNAPGDLVFPTNLSNGTAVISVEPENDNSPDPYALKPLLGNIPSSAESGVVYTMEAGPVNVTGSGSQALPDLTSGRIQVAADGASGYGVSVAQAPGGSFFVAWTGTQTGSTERAILARGFRSDGAATSGVVALNNASLINTSAPQVSAIGNTLLTTWQGVGPDDISGVFGRLSSELATPAFSISPVEDYTIAEGDTSYVETITLTIINDDGEPDSPEFVLSSNAPGAEISSTGVITFPVNESTGPRNYRFIVTAIDGAFFARTTFNIFVEETNQPPSLPEIADRTFTTSEGITAFTISAATDDDIPVDTITYSAVASGTQALPDWLTFNAETRTFDGNANTPVAGTWNITVTANDGAATDSSEFEIRITGDSVPFTINSISDQTIAEGTSAFTFELTAAVTDGDGVTDSPTFTLNSDAPGAFIELTTGQITVPIGETSGGMTYDFTVTASQNGFSQQESFTLTVTETNSPPTIGSIADQSLSVDDPFEFEVPEGMDSDIPAQTLTYSVLDDQGNALPDWLQFAPSTRRFTGTPPAGSEGRMSVVVSVSDGFQTAFTSFDILVGTSELFELNTIPLTTVSIDSLPTTIRRTASINDLDGQTHEPVYSVASSTLSNVSIDSDTGELTVALVASDGVGTHVVNITASEGTFSDSIQYFVVVSASASPAASASDQPNT